MPENMRASLSRTPVELNCYHCGHVWQSRAKSGGTTRCPECLRNRRIPSDARATSDPAWQRDAALAARLADDPTDPAVLPPLPETGRYGAAERAATASNRRPRGKRQGRAHETYTGDDGHEYDRVPAARRKREPCGECGKLHRAGTSCIKPRLTAEQKTAMRAEARETARRDAEQFSAQMNAIRQAAAMVARMRGVSVPNVPVADATFDDDGQDDYTPAPVVAPRSTGRVEYLPDTSGGQGVPITYIDISGKSES